MLKPLANRCWTISSLVQAWPFSNFLIQNQQRGISLKSLPGKSVQASFREILTNSIINDTINPIQILRPREANADIHRSPTAKNISERIFQSNPFRKTNDAAKELHNSIEPPKVR